MTDAQDTNPSAEAPRRQLPAWAFFVIVGACLAVGGTLFVLEQRPKAAGVNNGLPDLIGKDQPAVTDGTLQVKDLGPDPSGYTGTIVVRGVVAMVSKEDPKLVALIDSREARVCRDLNCANFYLQARVNREDLKPWDEVDVRGTVAQDAKMVFLKAESVASLGSVKR